MCNISILSIRRFTAWHCDKQSFLSFNHFNIMNDELFIYGDRHHRLHLAFSGNFSYPYICNFHKTPLYIVFLCFCIYDIEANNVLQQLIPDCSVLRTPTILKNIRNSLIFLQKWLLTHVFGGSQVHKSSCKQACIGFPTFLPWYHHIIYLSFFSITTFTPSSPT